MYYITHYYLGSVTQTLNYMSHISYWIDIKALHKLNAIGQPYGASKIYMYNVFLFYNFQDTGMI